MKQNKIKFFNILGYYKRLVRGSKLNTNEQFQQGYESGIRAGTYIAINEFEERIYYLDWKPEEIVDQKEIKELSDKYNFKKEDLMFIIKYWDDCYYPIYNDDYGQCIYTIYEGKEVTSGTYGYIEAIYNELDHLITSDIVFGDKELPTIKEGE